jgi:hypothetical protein
MKDVASPNWNELVRFLLEHHTQTELSLLTKVHQGTISDLNRGVDKPRLSYESGAALIKAQTELNEYLLKINQLEEA